MPRMYSRTLRTIRQEEYFYLYGKEELDFAGNGIGEGEIRRTIERFGYCDSCFTAGDFGPAHNVGAQSHF